MKISFGPMTGLATAAAPGTLVLPVLVGGKLPETARALDKRTKGLVSRAIAGQEFAGKLGEVLVVPAAPGLRAARLLLVGLGDAAELTELKATEIGGAIGAALRGRTGDVAILAELPAKAGLAAGDFAALLAQGVVLRGYHFDKYRTHSKDKVKFPARLVLHTPEQAEARRAHAPLQAVAEGVALARDLVTEPPNVIYPESMAERCLALRALGVQVTVLDEKALTKLGMGALLGVAQGSIRPPRLVAMEWNGLGKNAGKPIALVGKGVTFDTGGITLKPGQGMEDMKYDMAGAAAVVGTMHALASRKARSRVVGLVGLVENMPSGAAQRPSDVVTSLSGQTIEVLNTDAEGRLVLCDVLTYAQRTYDPRLIIDLATLTGACVIALGTDFAGLMSNDDALAERLLAAGNGSGDRLWRLPLCDGYDQQLKSPIADMMNIAGWSRNAGSSIGGQFLQRFIDKGRSWAHLDIAGMAWAGKDLATVPKGATGFGVRLLDRFIARHGEEG